MAMPESMLRNWELLTEQNRAQIQNFVDFLLAQQQGEKRKNPRRKLGVLEHRFRGISEDFDAPLPEFEEYMP